MASGLHESEAWQHIVFQLAEWVGWLGSAGGPESSSTPLGIALLLTSSVLLAPSFVVMMIGVRYLVPESRQIWAQAGIAFATVYATLIGIVYCVQFTLVMPRVLQGRTEGVEVLVFTPFDSFLYSVDLLGYSSMSLDTLFAAFGLVRDPSTRTARRFYQVEPGRSSPRIIFGRLV